MISIESLWLNISEQKGSAGTFRLFDQTHPLDLFAGIDLEGRRVLMLVTDEAPLAMPPAGVIEVRLTQRADGRFNLIFRLVRSEYQELFGHLCQDLIEISRTSDRKGGTAVLLLRLGRWRRLLEAGPRQGLSEKQLRGLFGELWFLKTVALPAAGPLAAVHAWRGPLGAAQDFQLFDSLVEIKTVLPGTHRVTISSADQLEHGDTPFQLAVFVIDTAQGISTVDLIEELRQALQDSAGAAAEFELRLAEAGYSERPEHGQFLFTVLSSRYYTVGENFPSLVASRLPAGISRLTYELDLMHCGPSRSEYVHAAR